MSTTLSAAAQELLTSFLAEKRTLGFSYNTEERTIRYFLSDFTGSMDGKPQFTKEYVLSHIGNRLNQKSNTILRDASAINSFLDFVIRQGGSAYKLPPKTLPKEHRNFKAYIFTEDEIERILYAADHAPHADLNPARQDQLPVVFRILFNCGLRVSEVLKLRKCDVDLDENVFTVLDTKFHKNRFVPFSDVVADALKLYLEKVPLNSPDSLLFLSPSSRSKEGQYGNSWLRTHFHLLLKAANIPYGGPGKGPRLHDTRHTFAVHCLNNWVLSGEDLTAALPVLSRYLGHNGLSGTQKYLQLTAQMYPDIVAKLEAQFGDLIPQVEVSDESI